MKQRIVGWVILFSWLFITPMAVSTQDMKSLDNARLAYEREDYPAAIQFFDLTISGGIYNSHIFFNLGNAHYQNGDIGFALLNYRRALEYIPRDLDLNIQLARSRSLRNTVQQEITHPIIAIEQLTANLMTVTELANLTLILWTSFWIIFIISRLSVRLHSTLNYLKISILFVLFGLCILLAARFYVNQLMPPAIITSATAPVYSGPSISYFQQYEVFEGSEIYIVEIIDEWVKFVMADTRTGWVESEFIDFVSLN